MASSQKRQWPPKGKLVPKQKATEKDVLTKRAPPPPPQAGQSRDYDDFKLNDDAGIEGGGTRDLNDEGMMLLNNIISNARGAGVDGDKWKAPVVLCMGPQSSGKSSLIWRLTGLPMPRDSTMCTKCPQEIRMNYGDKFRCQIRIRREYDDYLQRLEEVDERSFGEEFTDLAEFEHKVKAASDSIVPGRSFSLTMLIVEVSGPDFPPINIVDMPGKVQAGFKPRVVEINRRMYEEYMKRDECIMLVLHQSMNNFENNDVYAFAKRYDPQGARTIGILTKPDKVSNPGEEANAFEVLRNDPHVQSHMPHGWYAVMNPPQDQQGKYAKPTAFDKVEGNYFKTDRIWSKGGDSITRRIGFDVALKKLLEFYHKQAQRSLPSLEGLARNAKSAAQKQLDMLPKRDNDKPQTVVNCLIMDLSTNLSRFQDGYVAKAQGLWNSIMACARDLEFICDSSKPRFKFLNDMTEKDMERVPEKYRPLFAVHTKDDVYCKMEEFRGRDVSLEINADRMIELFYSETWDRRRPFIKERVQNLKQEVLDVVKDECVKSTFDNYPTFFERISYILEEVIRNAGSLCSDDFDQMIDDFKLIYRVRVNPQQHYDELKKALVSGETNDPLENAETYLLVSGEHIEFRVDKQSSWKRARVVQVSADGTKARIKYRAQNKDHIKWIHVHTSLVRRGHRNGSSPPGSSGGAAGGKKVSVDIAKKETAWRVDYDNGREWYWNKKTQQKSVEKPAIFNERPELYYALAMEKAPPQVQQKLKTEMAASAQAADKGDKSGRGRSGAKGGSKGSEEPVRTFLLDPVNPIEARIGQVTAAVRAYIEERDKAFLHAIGNRLVRRFITELKALITQCTDEFMNCGTQEASTLLSIDSSQEELRKKLQDKIKKLQKVEKQLQDFRGRKKY